MLREHEAKDHEEDEPADARRQPRVAAMVALKGMPLASTAGNNLRNSARSFQHDNKSSPRLSFFDCQAAIDRLGQVEGVPDKKALVSLKEAKRKFDELYREVTSRTTL